MSEIEVTKEQAIAPRPIDKFAEYATSRAQIEAPLVAQELGASQGDAILNATTEEELDAAMETAGLIGLRDVPDGTEIQINGFHYAPGNRSEFKNRFGIFAVMECTILSGDDAGRDINIDTGVERIIMWLRAREAMSGFPAARRISKTVTGGGEMITLLPLPKRVTKS